MMKMDHLCAAYRVDETFVLRMIARDLIKPASSSKEVLFDEDCELRLQVVLKGLDLGFTLAEMDYIVRRTRL